jgi:antitoxin MazE
MFGSGGTGGQECCRWAMLIDAGDARRQKSDCIEIKYLLCRYIFEFTQARKILTMQTTIKKWGNSLAVRLPQNLATDLHMTEGATVSLTVQDETLVISASRKKYKLADLLKNHTTKMNHVETDWGNALGDEVW